MRRHLRLMSVAAALAASILLGACKNTADAEEPDMWTYDDEELNIYAYLNKATPGDYYLYGLSSFKFSEENYIAIYINVHAAYYGMESTPRDTKTVSGTYTGDLTKNGPVTITFEFNGTDFTLEGNLVGDTIYFGEYPYKKQ